VRRKITTLLKKYTRKENACYHCSSSVMLNVMLNEFRSLIKLKAWKKENYNFLT